MTGWPDQPVIYEVNTAVWLGELSRTAGRRLTLADVARDRLGRGHPGRGRRGVADGRVGAKPGRACGGEREYQELRHRSAGRFPICGPTDIIGSPYCVRRYVVDAPSAARKGWPRPASALAARGVRLLLDYVPNHVAPDHPWVTSRPRAVRPRRDSATSRRIRRAGLQAGGHVLAHGRDPYFPPWPDVVQLDAFSPGPARRDRADAGRTSPDQCDGIRCDMAMLMTNDVFAKTWGGRTGPPAGAGVLADRHRPSCASGTRRPCCSPRPTGTWNGSFSSKASTSATTSDSTTGSSAGTPRRPGPPAGRPRLPVAAAALPGEP